MAHDSHAEALGNRDSVVGRVRIDQDDLVQQGNVLHERPAHRADHFSDRFLFLQRGESQANRQSLSLLLLNQPVEVDIPPQPAGKELNFTCPMNMLKGKAVTR